MPQRRQCTLPCFIEEENVRERNARIMATLPAPVSCFNLTSDPGSRVTRQRSSLAGMCRSESTAPQVGKRWIFHTMSLVLPSGISAELHRPCIAAEHPNGAAPHANTAYEDMRAYTMLGDRAHLHLFIGRTHDAGAFDLASITTPFVVFLHLCQSR